ncbi:MAG: CinA family protein [Dehalococcoidia bacterium]|nr:CinA family protein [Dehalococcoidia bacterium]
MTQPAQKIIELLGRKKLTLAVTESATGGLISHMLTSVPGSSAVYKGSVTAYSNQVKMNVLGVKAETLEKFGAVSSQVAEEMALGGCRVLDADICVSDTGIAGPGGATFEKPVGLFYLGLAHHRVAFSQKCLFHGNRDENKDYAAQTVLDWLDKYIQNGRV